MEKISFEHNVEIYKTKIESETLLASVVREIESFLKIAPYSQRDNYTYMPDWSSFDFENEMKPKNPIEEVIKFSLSECFKLRCLNTEPFNKININSWINVVKSGKPKQESFKKNGTVELHNHVDLQKAQYSFYPTYTFVYYAQMPDNLIENEGTLIIGGTEGNRYYYLPEEGDLIIMEGHLPHSPERSPNSSKNRIVIAANVGFEKSKKQISLI